MGGRLKDNLSILKYAKEFEREIMRINYNRMFPIAIVLYLIEWVIFYFNHLFFDIGLVVLIFQIFSTILLLLMFITHKNFETQTILKLKVISYLYLIGLIVFGAFLVYATPKSI